MRVIPPITFVDGCSIVDSMLTSSVVAEIAPAAYVAGTTYAQGDRVSVAGAAGLMSVYQSLQAANTGHAPASSTTWWKWISDTYQTYSAGATYAAGDIVIVVGTNSHHTYQSLQAANTGHTPASSPAWWFDLGPTNRWKMFDLLRNTQTVAASPLTVVLTPGQRVNSLALFGLVADALEVSVVSGGMTVFNQSYNLSTRAVVDWYDYFFEPFTTMPSMALFDIPPYADGVVTITLTRTGNVSCGGVVVGNNEFIGDIQYKPKSDAINFSSVTRDTFGNATLVQRRSIPKTTQTMWLEKARVNRVSAIRDALNAVPAVWSGLDDPTDGYFESLFILGFYRSFSIDLDYPREAQVSLELEEI